MKDRTQGYSEVKAKITHAKKNKIKRRGRRVILSWMEKVPVGGGKKPRKGTQICYICRNV